MSVQVAKMTKNKGACGHCGSLCNMVHFQPEPFSPKSETNSDFHSIFFQIDILQSLFHLIPCLMMIEAMALGDNPSTKGSLRQNSIKGWALEQRGTASRPRLLLEVASSQTTHPCCSKTKLPIFGISIINGPPLLLTCCNSNPSLPIK